MRTASWRARFGAIALTAAVAMAAIHAQAPPKELRAYVLSDVGPLPAPSSCGCVTAPFTYMPPRPGWGYAYGPAAPETDAPPSRFEREHQAGIDRETLANLPFMYADAIAGNGHASITIVYELTTGTALKRDEAQATQWAMLAAKQGHPDAFVQLGHRYHRGLGIEQNDDAAAYWFRRGASAGSPIAMSALGGLYASGQGLPQDWAVAVEWWRKAGAWRFVGDAYACGLGVAESMDDAVLAYEKAMDAGDAQSAIQVGNIHARGCVSPSDLDVAFTSYKSAADRGYPDAQVALSELLLRPGPRSVPSMAYFWARLAELRLPSGELRTRAQRLAGQATRQMKPPEITSYDAMIGAMIAAASEPMLNR